MRTVDVVLVTAEEPLYLPRALAPVVEAHGDVLDEVAIVPPPGGAAVEALRYLRSFGPVAAARLGASVARGRLLDRLPGDLGRRLTGRHHGVASLARDGGVPVHRAPDVEAAKFLDRLLGLDPDLLLSVACPRRLPESVLDVPDLALNLHASLLPKYRGRATAFWPLYHGEETTGVTAHLLTGTLDAGPIVERRRVPIDEGDSMHDLSLKLAGATGALAVDLVERLEREGVDGPADLDPRPNPTGPDDYHTLPTPAERREFRRRGNEFV